jgi:hypothetical protein
MTIISDERSVLDEASRRRITTRNGFFCATTDEKTVVSAVKLLNEIKTQLDAGRPKSAEPPPTPIKSSPPAVSKERARSAAQDATLPGTRGKWTATSTFPSLAPQPLAPAEPPLDRFRPLPLQEMAEAVAASRSAAAEREHSLEWLTYWGNLRRLKGEQSELSSKITAASSDAARLAADREALSTQLEWAAGHVKDLEQMIATEREEAAAALKSERLRLSDLLSENDRLKNKQSEMRYEVNLAEKALHKVRLESDEAIRTAATLTREMEHLRLTSTIEITQLRKELTTATFSTEKQARLEQLESETSRQSEQIATLFKTIDLVTSDNKALHERLQSSAAPVAAALRRGMSLDAGSIQQMAQKQFQKVEQDLTELVATLRRENEKHSNRSTGMRVFLEHGLVAFESDLMCAHDIDANSGARFILKSQQLQQQLARPRKGAGPPQPQYTAGPLIFQTLVAPLSSNDPIPADVSAVAAGLSDVIWKDVVSLWASCKDATEKLWSALDKAVPSHPNKSPSGAKETLHAAAAAAIQRGYLSLQHASTRQAELSAEICRAFIAKNAALGKAEGELRELRVRVEVLTKTASVASDTSAADAARKRLDDANKELLSAQNKLQALTKDLSEAQSEVTSLTRSVESCVSNSRHCSERVSSCLGALEKIFQLPVESAHVQHVDDSFFERDAPPQAIDIFRSIIFAVERHGEALSVQRTRQLREAPIQSHPPAASAEEPPQALIEALQKSVSLQNMVTELTSSNEQLRKTNQQLASQVIDQADKISKLEAAPKILSAPLCANPTQNPTPAPAAPMTDQAEKISKLEAAPKILSAPLCGNPIQNPTPAPAAPTASGKVLGSVASSANVEKGAIPPASATPAPSTHDSAAPLLAASVRSVGVNTVERPSPERPSSSPLRRPGSGNRAGSPTRPQSPKPDCDLQFLVGSEVAAAHSQPTGRGPLGSREAIHGRAGLQPSSLPVVPSIRDGQETLQRKVRSAAAVHRVRFTQAMVGAPIPKSKTYSAAATADSGTESSFVPFLTTRRLV